MEYAKENRYHLSGLFLSFAAELAIKFVSHNYITRLLECVIGISGNGRKAMKRVWRQNGLACLGNIVFFNNCG